VKFQREVLIEKAKARRLRIIQRTDEENRTNAQKHERLVFDAMAKRDLRPLINLLRRSQDNNTPLSKKDFTDLGLAGISSDRWDSRVTMTFPILLDTSRAEDLKANTVRIDQFIAFLEAATDDEVSSTALFQHGFKDFPNLT